MIEKLDMIQIECTDVTFNPSKGTVTVEGSCVDYIYRVAKEYATGKGLIFVEEKQITFKPLYYTGKQVRTNVLIETLKDPLPKDSFEIKDLTVLRISSFKQLQVLGKWNGDYLVKFLLNPTLISNGKKLKINLQCESITFEHISVKKKWEEICTEG